MFRRHFGARGTVVVVVGDPVIGIALVLAGWRSVVDIWIRRESFLDRLVHTTDAYCSAATESLVIVEPGVQAFQDWPRHSSGFCFCNKRGVVAYRDTGRRTAGWRS